MLASLHGLHMALGRERNRLSTPKSPDSSMERTAPLRSTAADFDRHLFLGVATIALVKRTAAAFLLIALFLPLSQCTVQTPNPETKTIEVTTTVTYAYSANEWPSLDALETYGAFLWPFLFSVTAWFWPRLNHKPTIPLLEALLCCGSGLMLAFFLVFGTPLYGWYIAAAAVATYFLSALAELVAYARVKWSKQT